MQCRLQTGMAALATETVWVLALVGMGVGVRQTRGTTLQRGQRADAPGSVLSASRDGCEKAMGVSISVAKPDSFVDKRCFTFFSDFLSCSDSNFRVLLFGVQFYFSHTMADLHFTFFPRSVRESIAKPNRISQDLFRNESQSLHDCLIAFSKI